MPRPDGWRHPARPAASVGWHHHASDAACTELRAEVADPETLVDIDRIVGGSPAAAWALLTDIRAWPRWGPTVADVDLHPPVLAPGVRGRVRTPVGPWLPFEITHLDPGHRWAWKVAGIPATGHRVEPAAGGARVVFELPLALAVYAPVCWEALRRLDRELRGPGTAPVGGDGGGDGRSAGPSDGA